MRKLYLLLVLCCLSVVVKAQTTAAGYSYSATTGNTFTSISGVSGVTTISSGGAIADDASSGSLPIGFTFVFAGTSTTLVSACSNGWISLANRGVGSPTAVTASISRNNTATNAGTIGQGMIAWGYDDNNGGSSTLRYVTTGSSPNRVFTIEFANWGSFTGTGTANVQIKLYETTNIIQILYGTNNFASHTLSVGISNTSTDFISVNTSTNASSTSTFTTSNATLPASGVMYSFCPTAQVPTLTMSSSPACTPATISGTTGLSPTYAWSPTTSLSSTNTSSTTATPAATTVYTLTANNNGCVATGSVTVNPTPSAISGSSSVCSGKQITLSSATTGGTWTSSATGVATVGSSSGVVGGVAAGTATITYTKTGCFVVYPITVNATPTLSVSSSNVYCSGSSGTTITASGTGTSYSWSPSGSLSAATGSSVVANPSASQTYTVVSTLGSCTIAATNALVYHTVATMIDTTLGGGYVCLPGTTPYFAVATLTPTTVYASFGTYSTSNSSIATVDAVYGMVYGVGAGTATISYTDASCSYTVSQDIRVYEGGFSLSISPSTPTYCNSGSPVTLVGTPSGGTADVYLWTFGDLSTATGLSSTNTASTDASPSATSTYLLSATNSTSGCHAQASVTVTNNTPVLSGSTTSLCVNGTTTWTSSGGAGTWSTSASGVASVNASTGLITAIAPGTANIRYTVTATGCWAERTITVNALPSISISPSTATICATTTTGSTLSLTASGGVTYTWSPATNLSATTGASVTFTAGSSTTYTATGTSSLGCSSTATRSVVVGTAVTAIASLTPTSICPGGSTSLTAYGALTSGAAYSVRSVRYDTLNLTSPTGVTFATADDNTTAVTMPFTFNFYGVNYTSVNIGTNGYVNFGTGSTVHTTGGVWPSSTAAPLGGIAAYYADISASTTGAVFYQTFGSAPNRKFVVRMVNGACCSGGTGYLSQIILYETSNIIDVMVNNTLSQTLTCGVQNAAGTVATTAPGRSAVTYQVTVPEGWRFYPTLSSPTYSWTPVAGLSTSTSATPTASGVASSTTYTVTITDASTGCSSTGTTSVNVYTPPTVSISAATPCSGVPMTASGASTYTWAPNTSISATVGATVTATPGSAVTYTATGTDANGCTGTATKTINPTPTITASSGLFCSSGAPFALTGAGGSTYSWTPSTGLSATTGSPVNASPTATTVYTVTGTTAAGCVGTGTTTVTYNVATGPISGPSITLCLPGAMNLDEAGTGGTWSSSDDLIATVDAAGIVYGVAPTSGTPVTITYNNPACGGSATYDINVASGGFTVSLSPTSGTYCTYGGTPLAITASGATDYSWDPATGLDASTGATVNASPSTTTIYTVTGTTGSCSNTNTITVTNNTPVISGGSTSICSGVTTTWTATGGAGTWSSSATGVATVNPSTGAILGVAAGTANITYTVTSSGCYSTRVITINGTPSLSTTPTNPALCSTTTGVNIVASGASTYVWTPSTGLSATTGASVIASPTVATTYTITGTSAAGCVATLVKSVSIGGTMTPTITAGSYTVCPGGATTLSVAVGSTYTVSAIPYTLLTQTSPTAPTMSAVDDGTTSAITLPFTFKFFGTNYTSVFLGTNGYINFGAAGSTLHSTGTVWPSASGAPPAGIAAFYADLSASAGNVTYSTEGTAPNRKFVVKTINGACCGGGTGYQGEIILYETSNIIDIMVTNTLSNTLTCGIQNEAGTVAYTAPGRSAATYQITTPEGWRFFPQGTPVAYAWTPAAGLATSTSAVPTATVSSATTYSVTVTDAAGCTGSAVSSVVNTYTPPTVSVTSSTPCSGSPMTASGAVSYTWAPNTSITATTGTTVTASPVSAVTYTATGTDANGCTGTATKTINPSPTVTANSGLYCSSGSPFAVTASGASTYTWSPSTGLSATAGTTVNASPTATTVYTVTGTTAAGCVGTATTTVTYNVATGPISGPSVTLCLPGSMNLDEAGTGGSWSSSDNLIATVDGGGIVYGVAPTSGTPVTITYNNPSCGGSATYDINVVNGGFTVSTTPTSGVYCTYGGTPLGITASGATDYSWEPATGLDVTTGATVNASPLVTTTYTVTGTTGSCSNTTTITVTNNTPVISGGSTSICSGITTTWTTTGGSGTWSSSATSVATVNPTTGAIQGVTGGTATITYTVTSTGCYATRDITVNSTPSLAVTPASAAVCSGSSVTMTASGASTYSWTPATGLSATNTASVVASPASSTTYTLTGVSAVGCSATLVKTVGYGTAVTAAAAAAASTVCPGSATTLTATAGPTGYSVSSIPYSFVTQTSPTAPSMTAVDDGTTTSAITLPFTFRFYGVNYTSVWLGTNGYINFGASGSTLHTTGTVWPSATAAPLAGIAAFYADISASAGNVTYSTEGTAPNRKFVVKTINGACCGGGTGYQGEIILYESSNIIDIMVTNTLSNTLTCGIQNETGTLATTAPGRSAATYQITTPEGWRFFPPPSSFSYAWSPSTGLSSTTASGPTATVSSATTYSVTITDPSSGCNATATTAVGVFTPPTVGITLGSTACAGGTMSGTGALAYAWSPSTGLSATNVTTVTASPATAVTYTVTGTDVNGCTGTATQIINPTPVLTLTPTSATYCSTGSPVGISASGASTYSWSPSTGLDVVTGSSVNASPSTSSVYTVTGTSAAGCIGTGTTTVTSNIATTAISGPSAILCLPGTMILTEGGSGGSWSSSNTSIATVSAAGIVYGVSASATPITITYNNPTCGGSADYTITVADGGFTVSTTPSSGTYCASGSPLSVTASGATTYVWTPADGLNTTVGATVSASPSVTTTYTVTGTTGSCSNSANITVTNNTPVISGTSTSLCAGQTTTWTSTGGSGTWSSSATGVATVNASTGAITGVAGGTANITFTVTSTGCYAVRAITINALPTLSATPTVAAACSGTGVTIVASGASTYSWAPATGLNTTLGTVVTATPTVATTYTITGTSAIGCSSTMTKFVGVGTTFTATATAAATTVCPASTTTLSVATAPVGYTVASTPYAFVTQTSPVAPTMSAVDDGTSAAITLPFTFNFYGVNYTSVFMGTNGYINFGASGSTVHSTGTVWPSASGAPLAGIAAFYADLSASAGNVTYSTEGTAPNRKFVVKTINGACCGGGTGYQGEIILYETSNIIDVMVTNTLSQNLTCGVQNATGTAAVTAPGRSATTYQITTPEGWRFTPYVTPTYAWSPASAVSSSTIGSPVATVNTPTTFSVTVTDYNSGCSSVGTVTVNNFTPPTVTIPTPTIGCAGTAMTASGATTYAWSPSTGLSATTGATVTPSATVTATTYSVIGTDGNGCKDTAALLVNPMPVVTVTPTSNAICGGGTSTLTASGASTYSWTPSATLSSSTDAAVTATPGSTTVYSVVGTSAEGCLAAVKTGTVTVNPAPVAGAVSAPAGYCLGVGIPLTITSGAASGSGTLISYNWTGPDGFSTTTSSPSVSFTPTSTAASGQYSLTVTYSGAACTSNVSVSSVVTVADFPTAYNVTGGNGCSATGITVGTDGSQSGITYALVLAPSTTAQTLTGTGTGLTFTPVSTAGSYQVIATGPGGCQTTMTGADTIRLTPTITPGVMPSICQGTLSQSIGFAPATGSPATYSIDWSSAANTAGFTDITNAALGTSIDYTIPASGAVGLFTGTITVSNGYCVSAGYSTTLTVYATPTMTMTDTIVPCYGYAGSIEFSGPDSTTVNYRVNGGALNHFTFSGTTHSLSTGVLTAPVTYQIVSASNPVCATTYNDTVTITPTPMMWVGGTPGFETDWNTASNWSCGFVPTATDSVTIPGTLYAPEMPAAVSATVSDLEVTAGTVINLNASSALHVTGNVHNSGTVAGNGRLIMSGASAQKIYGIGTISNLELDNSNGATIQPGARTMISSTLYLTAGTLTTNDSLELLSTDTFATARIAEIPPTGASVSGRVKTDQYVQGGYRRWRFWGHCFSDTIALIQLQPYIDITGPGGASRGFTTTTSNAPSAFWHNPYGSADDSTGYDPGWRAFNDIRTTAADSNLLHPGQGIRLFFRGSKGEGLGYLGYLGMYTPSASISKMIGHVNQGAVSVYLKRGTASQTLNQLSNPYPSPVDLGTAAYYARQAGQITGYAFYVWNPAIGAGGQYMPIPIGTSAPEPFYLPANTSYQVRAAYDGAHLDFQESYKSANRTINLFRAPANAVRFNIYDSNYHIWDVLSLQFNDKASDAEDKLLDAIKPAGLDFNFYSIASDGRRLAVDARPYEGDKVIPLGLNSSFQQDFVIRAESISVPAGGAVTLHDKLLNKYVEMKEGTEYRFTIGKDRATQGNERFELTLKPAVNTAKGLEVSMAPNPASDDVKITFTSGSKDNVSVRIMDVSGVSIYNQNLGTKQNGVITVPMSNFAAGVYMVEITQGEQKVTKRLVKE
jgi:metal-sulfur cluster biosynthetic enzyme